MLGDARGVICVSIGVCGGNVIHEKGEGGLNRIIMCLHGCLTGVIIVHLNVNT